MVRQLQPNGSQQYYPRTDELPTTMCGVGLKQIAKVSQVAHGTLWKLVYGMPGRGPSKRVRKATLDRLLTVSPADIADGARRPAGPTWALIEAMVSAGVPKARIAEAIGQTGPGLQLGREWVTAGHHRAVVAMHADWQAGRLELVRRSRFGTHPVAPPAPVQRARADVSDLLIELAEIVELRNSQPWRAQAACRTRPVYLWFPARGDDRTEAKGLQICGACTVRDRCRAEMFTERAGTYGALTAGSRRKVLAADRIAL